MSYSGIIEQHKETLESEGWTVEVHCHHSLPDFTAYVDFDKKCLWLNNPKASYSADLFERVVNAISNSSNPVEETKVVGMYHYQWKAGELLQYVNPEDPDHTEYNYLYLSVTPVRGEMAMDQVRKLMKVKSTFEPTEQLQEVEVSE